MAQEDDERSGGIIRAISRSLRVLSHLNEYDAVSLNDLQAATNLPKSTLHRILATLIHDGYVKIDSRYGSYRVTENVRMLGAGYSLRSRLIDVGAPIAKKVTGAIKWPLALGTLEGSVIVVRYSTMPYSPLAVQATTVGHRLSLLGTASGLAYLSFCDPTQQQILVDDLLKSANSHDEMNKAIWAAIRLTYRRGYGLRLPNKPGDSATAAVPIKSGEEILGVLSMTTFGKVMSRELIAEHLPVLKATAEEIFAAVKKP